MHDTFYVVHHNADGTPYALFRFRKDETGSYEEELDAYGHWVQDNSLASVVMNLHSPAYDEVTEAEATEIARKLVISV